jgi:hypothetical protein
MPKDRGKTDDGPNDRAHLRVTVEAADERLVDLDLVEGELLKIASDE